MKKFLVPILFLLVHLSFLSCKKEGSPTVITGTVTNKTTGEPVQWAFLYCYYTFGERPRDISSFSDNEGKYKLEIPHGHSFSFSNAYKEGFLPKVGPTKGYDILTGETNVVDIALIPNDGFLRVNLQNDSPLHDSLYLYFFNPINAAQFAIGAWVTPKGLPFVVPAGGSYQAVFGFPSEVFTTFYWGTQKFSPGADSPLRDSVFLPRNDTLDFTIHF